MEIKFRYEIGQVVALAAAPDWRFQVVQRYAIQCTGGIQNYYEGRTYQPQHLWYRGETDNSQGFAPGTEIRRYHEIELAPIE